MTRKVIVCCFVALFCSIGVGWLYSQLGRQSGQIPQPSPTQQVRTIGPSVHRPGVYPWASCSAHPNPSCPVDPPTGCPTQAKAGPFTFCKER